jgi:anti-sigma factor RsiW
MTCKDLTDFLDDYLAGDLQPDVRGRFEAHLGDCPDCLVYLQGYRDTVGLVRDVGRDPDAEASTDVPAELVRAILAARTR